ncbi:MAG TPA: hypothetical protein VHQ46_03250 [Desulfobacteria bacterium]|nr:hypothetical protein [Desulfobacteria bacterium]
MDLVANLEKILYQYQTAPPVQDLRIQGWRFAVSETSQVKAGIRNNRLGGVYAAPSLTGNYAGDLLIIWPGDYCSQVVVNNKIISNLEQMLPIWKQGAFYDPEGSALLDPAPLPLVAVEHLPVRQAVTEDPKPCFEILARYRDELPTWQVNTIQAGVQAGWGLRHIRTSRGFSVTYAQTNFSTFVSASATVAKYAA